ncbi:hypothetical protein L4174_006795 [Photobacterium sp. CCB-ST2H9]|uniref:hypothetical protein n=1 Tax=Photobacterium sp. CCB-ST2H9 TaxID=2912855 RepID=UPI0020055024|nr:hypothetical protein [Photobacterium sp. CCB-ST2H9]UTM58537.1 hypothetical protein L4174_006795 [Photobacterium sp. CCB-ST2H9]
MAKIQAKEVMFMDMLLILPSMMLILGQLALTFLVIGVVMLFVSYYPWFQKFFRLDGAKPYLHLILWGSLFLAAISHMFPDFKVYFITIWAAMYVLMSARYSERWKKGHH